jgi:predicted LPLAT superfamily acyltransferase
MSGWDGRSRGNTLGYQIFIFILKYVNIHVAYFVLTFIAAYFYFFSRKKDIRQFYREMMGYPALKAEWAIYNNYKFLGKVLIDKITVLAGFKNKFTFDFEGEDYLHQMANEGKGGIIIGAHAGNWEMAGFLLKRVNKPVHVLMYDGEQSNIKELLEKITGGQSFNTILIHENDLSHIYQIGKVLQKGELIAMHGDRFLPGSKVHSCTFMGKKANFPLGAFYISAQFKVPVCFVSTMKETNTHYHFYATPPVIVESENKLQKKQEIYNMAEKYAFELEKMVRKYPLQWFNYYNFWNLNNL